MAAAPKCRFCRHTEADHNIPRGNGLHCGAVLKSGHDRGYVCNCGLYAEPLPPNVTVRRSYHGNCKVTTVTVRAPRRGRR